MKYGPGDEIEVLLQIQHAPMNLSEVSARFFPEEHDRATSITEYVYMSGRPRTSEEQPIRQLYPDLMTSEVRMAATAGPELSPGVYRLNRVTVTTYGGKEHRYSGEELSSMNMDSLGFEIVEEPNDKPSLHMTIAPD
jgi:hypothetical protein